MAWRIQLTEGTIKRLDILSGRPSLLAAWLRSDHVVFLDLQSGMQKGETRLGEQALHERSGAGWTEFLASLRAPNHVFLPRTQIRGGSIYASSDGGKKLYFPGGGDLFYEADGGEVRLEQADAAPGSRTYVAVGMDRAFGIIAAVDGQGSVTLFNERSYVGTFSVGLVVDDAFRPIVLVTKGSSAVLVSDGTRLVALDAMGRVRHETELYFTVGGIACSSDGRRLVLSDLDANVVRVYSGADLRPTHQRYAVDLLAESKRLQLWAMPETGRSALGALAINSKGVVAFSLSDVLCVTSLARMKAVPRSVV